MDDVAAAAAAAASSTTTTYNVMYVNGAERVVVFKHTPTCMSVTVGNHLSYDIKFSSQGAHTEVIVAF